MYLDSHSRCHAFISIFDSTNIVYALQFGFRDNHLTDHALISMTESIRHTIENGKFVCGVFIDRKKAFETVTQSILPTKMEHYGIRIIALDWFTSYL